MPTLFRNLQKRSLACRESCILQFSPNTLPTVVNGQAFRRIITWQPTIAKDSPYLTPGVALSSYVGLNPGNIHQYRSYMWELAFSSQVEITCMMAIFHHRYLWTGPYAAPLSPPPPFFLFFFFNIDFFSYKQHFTTFYVSLYDIYTINTIKQ